MQNFLAPLLLGIGGYAGTPDYAGATSQYADTLNKLAQSYNPYIKGGFAAEKGLGALGAMNMIAPAALQNRLAAGFQDSPYQQQMQKNLSKQMDANAAMTGMLGSTSQNAALQNALAGQENQFQQQYINRAMGQYNRGLQNINQLGMLLASQGFQGTNLANQLRGEGALGTLQGEIAPTQSQAGLTGAISGILGML